MADNVGEHEVVLTFWSKQAKDAFLGGFCDGWGEDAVQFTWPKGTQVTDATHLEIQAFDDPGADPSEVDADYFADRWHKPGLCSPEERADAELQGQW